MNLILAKESLLLLLVLAWSLSSGCEHSSPIPFVEEEPACSGPIGEWQLLGLEGESVTAIAIHPHDSRILYVGTQFDFSAGVQGKLYKSLDCGTTWDTLLVGGSYRAIVFDPTNPEIVYALPGSIIKSSDGGKTWQAKMNGMRLGLEQRVQSLAIDPKNPNVLYAGVGGFLSGTLYKSTDAGENWIDLENGRPIFNTVSCLAIDPGNTNIVYAGTDGRGILFKTTDGGQTWNATGLGETSRVIDMVAISPQANNRIYAGVRFGGLYVSNDGGISWQKETLPDSVQNCTDLVFDSANEYVYAATGFGCFKKKALDSSWTEMNEGFGLKAINGLELSSNHVLYAGKSTLWEKGGGLHVRSVRR